MVKGMQGTESIYKEIETFEWGNCVKSTLIIVRVCVCVCAYDGKE